MLSSAKVGAPAMMSENDDIYSAITLRDALILRLLTERYSLSEISSPTHLSYSLVKKSTGYLEQATGTSGLGELARWWAANEHDWLAHWLKRLNLAK